jgi:hypothetical protein
MSFYSLSDEKIEEIWSRIVKKITTHENGCHIWTGETNDVGTPIYRNRKLAQIKINIPKLALQIFFPETKIGKENFTIYTTCKNKLCLSKDHLKIKIHIFTFEEAYTRLLEGSTRQIPDENFEIGCLLWNASKNDDRYGYIKMYGRTYGTHVLAIFIKEKIMELPINEKWEKLLTRHLCRNRHCCEATHLLLGTSKDNAMDKQKEGIFVGKNVSTSKITNELAKKIYDSKDNPQFKTREDRIAFFKTTRNIITSIDLKTTWACIHEGKDRKEAEENMKKLNDKRNKVAEQQRNEDFTEKELEMLKQRIYKKSTIQEEKKNNYNNVPCRFFDAGRTKGYGIVTYKHVTYFAHRLICEWKHGKKDNLFACHKCNNKACVEEFHIEWGTAEENSTDLIHAGTSKGHKLNMDKAREIRAVMIADPKTDKKELAAKYKINIRTLHNVISGKSWQERKSIKVEETPKDEENFENKEVLNIVEEEKCKDKENFEKKNN